MFYMSRPLPNVFALVPGKLYNWYIKKIKDNKIILSMLKQVSYFASLLHNIYFSPTLLLRTLTMIRMQVGPQPVLSELWR